MLVMAKGKDYWIDTIEEAVRVGNMSNPAARRILEACPEASDLREGDQVIYARWERPRYTRKGHCTLFLAVAEVVCFAGPNTVDVRIGSEVVGTRRRCLRMLPEADRVTAMFKGRNRI